MLLSMKIPRDELQGKTFSVSGAAGKPIDIDIGAVRPISMIYEHCIISLSRTGS